MNQNIGQLIHRCCATQGSVTTLQRKELVSLKAGLDTPLAPAKAAGLVPEFETIELLAGQLPSLKFDQLLAKFAAEAQLDGMYFFCNQDELLAQVGCAWTSLGLVGHIMRICACGIIRLLIPN